VLFGIKIMKTMSVFIGRQVEPDGVKAIEAFGERNQNISIIVAQYILIEGGTMLFYAPPH